jgi:2-polyprenyl-6-methoxyphenol hydroxylase-like FAD-dependent oxidoreductase
MTTSIAIIGGGPGGLMLARLLQLRGIAATIFERDAHRDERSQGGSLDLHRDTGQRAMRLAALEEAFLAEARPEHQGDRLYDAAGELLWDQDGAGHDRPEIDRTALRRILLDSLAPGSVRWGSKVDAIVPAEAGYRVTVNGTDERFDIVVGADGAWSRVRPLLSTATPVYEGVTAIELGFNATQHPDVAALVGAGKMFAAGNNRTLVGQLNGHGHVRGYAIWPMPEQDAASLAAAAPEVARARAVTAFASFAPPLLRMIETGDLLGIRSIYALPIGHSWSSRGGLTLLGDAAHVMSPFSGEGVNLALADAADLAEALVSKEGWAAVTDYEVVLAERAGVAAAGARAGLEIAISPNGVTGILRHYRAREAQPAES